MAPVILALAPIADRQLIRVKQRPDCLLADTVVLFMVFMPSCSRPRPACVVLHCNAVRQLSMHGLLIDDA